MTRRLETQVARKPGVRVFCALLVAAPAFAALLATGAVVHRGRTTRRPSVSGSYAVESEPTPGLGSEQDAGARSSWFYAQRAYPHAFTPREALIRAERQATALKSTPAPGGPMTPLAWTEIGPRPIATFGPATRGAGDMYMGSPPVSGRVTALASDPSNPDVIYLGSAVGGVWKSTDGGVSWAPIFPRATGSFSIGAIAVDPSNPQNVWVGTGDSNNVVGDSYYGLGIYKSTNGGASWTKVGGTTFDGCFVPDLAVVDSSTVVAAILEFPGIQNPACSSSRRGLWRTADGGSSWTQISLPNASHQSPSDLSQPQGQPSTIYLAAYYDGVFRSADGGATWTHLGIENLYRGAVSAYDANTAYVAYADPTTKDLAGVWKTVDGGAHWTGVVGPGGPNTPCDYNPPSIRPICDNALTLVVDPSDPTVFYVGGVRLFKYTNSGATATLVGWGACSSCIHLDQHASLYDASHRLWIGNDGGAYRSDDGAASFLNRNGSGGGALAISEFEPWTSGSVAGGTFIGGTQDDGEVKYTAATGLDWRMDIAGDVGATAFVSPTTYYATHFGPAVFKTVDSGTTFTDVSGPWAGESSQMYPPLVMSPTNTFTLYRGTTRIWKTFNGAESWSPISPIFDPPMGVSAIGLATSNPNGLYAGWSPYRGTTGAPAKLRYTTDGGATWSEVPSGQLPDRYISDIDVDPSNASIAVATFSGFGTGHVYRTTNGGTVWTNISGNLPDTPVDAVAVDYTTSPATVFVGTDVGVFWTIDSGTTWGNTSQDLPATVVMDLRIDGSSLIAATHGRGAWKASLPLPNPPPPLPPPPPPAPPAPPPPPPPPPPAPPPPTCRVPRVVGLTLARARPRIVRAHCRVGSVTFRASSPKKRGRVLRERPAPGRRLANRARVNLIVGKGPKKP